MTPQFGDAEQHAALTLIELALAEDLADPGDVTSRILIAEDARATIHVVNRQAGVIAGLPLAEMVFARLDAAVKWQPTIEDGRQVDPGTVLASVSGATRSLLAGERTALNFLGHLSGVATLTRRFVDAVAGTNAKILDTRKTLPGWRVLEKYAVRAGGGTNHRLGLFDGILIKDNHLAAWAAAGAECTIAAAVELARQRAPADFPLEVEVDTLDALREALEAGPDVVLLDNMPADRLRQAVALRNEFAPAVALEASGGITLDNVAEMAATGVERISIGALTHSAPALDVAFDWPA